MYTSVFINLPCSFLAASWFSIIWMYHTLVSQAQFGCLQSFAITNKCYLGHHSTYVFESHGHCQYSGRRCFQKLKHLELKEHIHLNIQLILPNFPLNSVAFFFQQIILSNFGLCLAESRKKMLNFGVFFCFRIYTSLCFKN